MKKLFKKLIKLIAAIFNRDPDKPSPVGPVPSWDKTTKASAHAQALQMLISELRRHDGDNAWERIPTEVP